MAGISPGSVWTDPASLTALKAQARRDDPGAGRAAAREFEALFVQMMLKSMRATSFDDSALNGASVGFYRDMFDQQLAVDLASRGELGIADMLERQLSLTGDEPASVDRSRLVSLRPGVAALPPGLERMPAQAAAATARAWLADIPDPAEAVVATVATRSPVGAYGESPEAFVRALAPLADAAAEQLGTRPEVLLAQAALETGWGRHVMPGQAGSSHNLFGIKAGRSWPGPVSSVRTVEYVNGNMTTERADFRAYRDPAASFSDYAALIGGKPRYAPVRAAGADIRGWAQALQDSGYATDPQYAEKIISIAQRITQMDVKL